MKLGSAISPLKQTRADIVAIFVHQDKRLFDSEIRTIERKLGIRVSAAATGDFAGKKGQTSILYVQRNGKPHRYLLVGLGEQKSVSTELYRRAAGQAAKRAKALTAQSLVLFLPSHATAVQKVASALAEGAFLSLYKFDRYVSKKEEDRTDLASVTICSESRVDAGKIALALHRTQVLCEATYLARDLANAPGNEIFPSTLADAAVECAHRCGFKATVLDEREIKDLGMGGIIGVSQGSSRPPRFIILEYGDLKKRPIVLVGKGVTFDSGGISIKPSAGMAEMKMDMSGAAAVIGAFEAASRLKLPVHIIGLIPTVENMPGGNSLRPGDIVRHFNGKTSEVDNTDAEGRLILADALGYAERYGPAAVIDLATLTGACVVALGHHASGMLGNDTSLMKSLEAAGETTYERVWQLPLFDEYEKLIKSDVADVKNTGGRWAGTITAALFLKKFIGSYKWVHLDIAGTAILEENGDYTQKGASGVGVRLLTEFLARWN